ncbi:MAG: sodium:solute symporter family protein [Flavobacteriales bacterium]
MNFSTLDWVIIISFLAITLFVGLYFKDRASKSLTDFFLAGRNLPWYIAGISMVATTFAADTPLWVTEVIHKSGISGNWLWWNMLIGGMVTTFFFAKLWRRADVLTELEFLDIRYSGRVVNYFRGFKAVYLGIFFNAIVIGWVNSAMIKIMMVFFGTDFQTAFYIVAGLMVLIAIYSSISGLLGVAITDALQFVLAMAGCVILAVIMVNSEQVGGIDGLKEKLPAWRFDFFPNFDKGNTIGTFTVSILAFVSFVGVQWWASWYPGAEPGGGGYISQRMMSTKSEKDSVFATLFFQIAHYCLRPWPWIIVGLCALVVYPELTSENAGTGFVMAMNDFMPSGLKGLLFTAFLGAYMSTISTQLNWGASYLTNDLYKRNFGKDKTQKQLVNTGKLFTILIMIVAVITTTFIETIDGAARFLIGSSAGLGAVLILRWYWWRINIWTEISATLAPILGFTIAKYMIAPLYVVGKSNSFIENEGILLVTTLFTTIVWLIVTFATKPTAQEKLVSFFNKVKPDGAWSPIRKLAGNEEEKSNLPYLIVCWVTSVWMTYSILFFIGKLIFKEWDSVMIWGASSLISLILFRIFLNKTSIFDKTPINE